MLLTVDFDALLPVLKRAPSQYLKLPSCTLGGEIKTIYLHTFGCTDMNYPRYLTFSLPSGTKQQQIIQPLARMTIQPLAAH